MSPLIKSVNTTLSAFLTIARYVEKIGSSILVVMMLLIVTDITLRRLFNSPMAYSFELIEVLLVVVAYCSVAYTTSVGRHVSIDLFVSRFSAKKEKAFTTVADVITLILFGLIGWKSIEQALHVQDIGLTTAILHVPKSPFIFVVAFGCILAFLVLIIRVLHSFVQGTVK